MALAFPKEVCAMQFKMLDELVPFQYFMILSDHLGELIQGLLHIFWLRPSGLGHVRPAAAASPDDGGDLLDDIPRMISVSQVLEWDWPSHYSC